MRQNMEKMLKYRTRVFVDSKKRKREHHKWNEVSCFSCLNNEGRGEDN